MGSLFILVIASILHIASTIEDGTCSKDKTLGCGLVSSSYYYNIKDQAAIQFNADEQHLLQSTWRRVIAPLSRENGANMFIDFITKNPQLKREFFWGRNNKSEMALRVDVRFATHVHSIFDAIGFGISRLDNMDSLYRFYTDLGQDHIPRGVHRAMFAPLADSFIYTLELALQEKFTPAVKAAYVKYYKHITGLMTVGLMGGDSAGLTGITAAEKAAVQAGWNKFAEDLEGNGAATFITLVKEYPEIKEVFPWGSKEVLSVDDADIRRHAELVFKGLGVAFKRIDNIESLTGYYKSLGMKHVARNVIVKDFDFIAVALHQTFEKILGADYTEDFKSGFSKVYSYVTSRMASGLKGSGDLKKSEKAAVRAGWAAISDLGKFGAKVFAKLVTMHPEIRSKFPWGIKHMGAAELIEDTDVQTHGDQVFRAFSLLIGDLDDIHALGDYYYKLGIDHIVRDIDPEDFQKLLDALLFVLKEEIGDLYTKNFKTGIESIYSFTVVNMNRGLRGEKHLSNAERHEAENAWLTFEVNLIENGVDVFLNLIEDHPNRKDIFPWVNADLSLEDLKTDPEFKKHAKIVFSALKPAFMNLDDLPSLTNFYVDIGNHLEPLNVPPVMISYLSDAFKKTFHKLLGKDYTDSLANTFEYVYDFVSSRIFEGISGLQILTSKHKQSIKAAFEHFFSENLAGNGVLVFLKFVHDHPHIVNVFPWGQHPEVSFEDMFITYREHGISGLSHAQLAVYEEMAVHAKQVFGGLLAAVDGLDNLESLAPYYHALGIRHIPRGAKAEQLLWFSDAILYSFKHILGAQYTSEFETGFNIWYNFITKHMTDGLVGGIELTTKEKDALVNGFAAVKHKLGKIGANAFVNLIESDVSYRKRFPWADNKLTTEELRSNPAAIAHGEKVLRGVALSVKNIENIKAFVPYFIDEGVRHVPRLVTEADFRATAKALLPAFEQELGALYTDDFKYALVALINFMADNMEKGLALASQKEVQLSANEITAVKKAFAEIRDIGRFGARVFVRLVKDHPQIRRYFPWGRNDLKEHELAMHPATKVHANQVFGALLKVIEGADHINDFGSFLVQLGTRHIARGIKPEHFDWLKSALVEELRRDLGKSLTPGGLKGLHKIYDFVQESMDKGLRGSTSVSVTQKLALKKGWFIFEEDFGGNGAKIFVELIKAQPSLRSDFPWGRNDLSYSELLVSPAVQKHAAAVFRGFGAAIHHAANLDATRQYYHNLGINHVLRAVRKEHFPHLLHAMKVVLKDLLGAAYTKDFVDGFDVVYNFVAKEMLTGLEDTTDLTSRQKEVILAAYYTLKADLEKHAVGTFLYLLQKHPELKQEFPWSHIPDSELRTSPIFIDHVLSVLQVYGVAIEHVGDLDSTTNYYIDLGHNSATGGYSDAAFGAIGESLLHTFKGILGQKYNEDFVTGFTHVLNFIVANIKVGSGRKY